MRPTITQRVQRIVHTAALAMLWCSSVQAYSLDTILGTGLTFGTGSSSPTTERMRILQTGNVGISNTAPKAKLDVVGTISASDAIQISGSSLTCAANITGGAIRYTSGTGIQYCGGNNTWTTLGTGTASAAGTTGDVQYNIGGALAADSLTCSAAITGSFRKNGTRPEFCNGGAWQSLVPVSMGTVASTSGTAIDFTGIPAWVTHITVMFNNVSTNAANTVGVQVGTSGGVVTTGYTGANSTINGSAVNQGSLSNSFALFDGTSGAAYTRFGQVELNLEDPTNNIWAASGVVGYGNVARTTHIGGGITLSGALDRIRITGNTDTFDAGSVNVIYQ